MRLRPPIDVRTLDQIDPEWQQAAAEAKPIPEKESTDDSLTPQTS